MGERDENNREEALEALKALAGLAAMAEMNSKKNVLGRFDDMAELLFNQYTAFCKAGFSEEHAFELLKILFQDSALKAKM